ncbi:MAG: HAD-IB family phosphatase [Dehalococcoidia bacterium]|nr:HAD-IB family phosphatase [Dehalococcoidia bacterium]
MTKTLVQCDFDGTVTVKDMSFLLLDEFAGPAWRELDDEYVAGKITVGRFNELAFNMVKASRQEMLDFLAFHTALRPGFREMAEYCRQRNIRLVVVSNGLDFYIDDIFRKEGISGVEYHAAETSFYPGGLKVRYVSPEGKVLDSAFKESYLLKHLAEGYRVAYIGDGRSDFLPAKQCQRVFATGTLLELCQSDGVSCMPFSSFKEIINELESW